MSTFTSGDGRDRDIMANVAARLMGHKPTAPLPPHKAHLPSQVTPSTPRSVPAAPASTSSSSAATISSPQTSKADHASAQNENARATWLAVEQISESKTSFQEDVTMTDVSAGPSLFGTQDQLAAARAFSEAATVGRQKSRGRSGHDSVLSRQPSRSSLSSSSSAPRISAQSSTIRAGYQAANVQRLPPMSAITQHSPSAPTTSAASSAPAPHSMKHEASTPANAWSEFAASPSRAADAMPVKQEAVGPVGSWNAFAASPVATETTSKTFDTVATPPIKTECSPTSPMSIPQDKQEAATPSAGRNLKDVTKALREGRAGATMPPHLRSRAAAAGIPESQAPKPVTSGTKRMRIDSAEFAPMEVVESGSGEKQVSISMPKDQEPTVKQESSMLEDPFFQSAVPITELPLKPAVNVVVNGTSKPQQQPRPAKPVMGNTASETKPGKTSVEDKDIIHVLDMVKQELTTIIKRVSDQEKETFAMQRQVEAMVQAEECRKFLGTNSAKAPFPLDVKCRNGELYSVQVTAELKVYELVRRVRAKADLAPTATPNAHIIIGGKRIGHMVTLGEVDVRDGTHAELLFSYDG